MSALTSFLALLAGGVGAIVATAGILLAITALSQVDEVPVKPETIVKFQVAAALLVGGAALLIYFQNAIKP